jgi:hypothetical protein
MREILPGVFHWSTFHEGIGEVVHSALLTGDEAAFLIDPREPVEGLDFFLDHGPPAHAYLTNRHHFRHSDRFARAFNTVVWCHREGLHEFLNGEIVRPFKHGDELQGRVNAVKIGALCPEETAFFIPRNGGLVALGDSIIRIGSELSFVPDAYMGADPEEVKRGLRESLERLLELDFSHLLLAHGEPIIDKGKDALDRFIENLQGGWKRI